MKDIVKMWCIAKSASIMEKPQAGSRTLAKIPFGNHAKLKNGKRVNGFAEAFYNDENGVHISGWVNPSGFCRVAVEDYARLVYHNNTGKRAPVTSRYHGKTIIGFVEPGEAVKMIARVGDWCLTSRGWSKFGWYEKERLIAGEQEMRILIYAIFARAVEDYRVYVKRLKQGRSKTDDEFVRTVWLLDDLTKWFCDQKYSIVYGYIHGKERVDELNEELGVTAKWLKSIHDKADEILALEGKVKGDPARRHTKSGRSTQKHRIVL